VTPGLLRWYTQKLTPFVDWCLEEKLTSLQDVDPHHLRFFLLLLEETDHNPGGRHGYYRAIRAFLNFFEEEAEPERWKNPIRKVGAPKVPDVPIEPTPVGEISKLIGTCDKNTFYGTRDRAIFLTLLDTGVRTMELVSTDLEDLNLIDGYIHVRKGKGGKTRVVLIGKRTE
jgi:site-specific recombinase XerD